MVILRDVLPRTIQDKVNDMHHNPVRAGLVDRPEDWRWSSALWYLERRTVGVPLHWIEC